MTIGLQLCRWYYQEIGAWKWESVYFVFFHQFFSLFLTYSQSKTLKKWMTLNKVLLVLVIHMTKQFWDKIGRFDADKYAKNVLKLECYKLVHAVIYTNTHAYTHPNAYIIQNLLMGNKLIYTQGSQVPRLTEILTFFLFMHEGEY